MSTATIKDEQITGGMRYLVSVPRRVVTVYIPLFIFLFVLLFPFYWMLTTSLKPNAELLSREGNPFWVAKPTLEHFHHLLFETPYPDWMWNTVVITVVATFFSLAAILFSYFGLQRRKWQQGGRD